MSQSESTTRREAIRELLRRERIGTQEELRERLAAVGFDVTQATLSRDLARLQVRRVTLAEGGSVYEIDGFSSVPPEGDLERVRTMVTGIRSGDAMVVVNTLPGAASAVALALDSSKLPTVLGTIAGDDTIFICPSRGTPPSSVVKHLATLWKKGILT